MERFINVYSDTNAITELNELEWIDGKIWANIYLKDVIVIINPENGAVESAIDFSDLKYYQLNDSSNYDYVVYMQLLFFHLY